MVQQFYAHDAAQVAFVGKLIKDGGGGAPEGVAKIDRVGQVDSQRQTVDRQPQPLAQPVVGAVFFPV